MRSQAARPLRLAIALLSAGLLLRGLFLFAQTVPREADGERIVGQTWRGERGVAKSTVELMASPDRNRPRPAIFLKREFEIPGRKHRPQDPDAPAEAKWTRTLQRATAT